MAAHLGEQVDHAHRFGHVARLADQRGDALRARRMAGEDGERVLDVDHAGDGIERPAIDGQARMAGLDEELDQRVEAGAFLDGDDVATQHRHVAHRAVAEIEQVLEHDALGRRQVAGVGSVVLMIFDRLGDLVTERRFGILAEQQVTQSRPQVPALSGGASTGIVWHDGGGKPLSVAGTTLTVGGGTSRAAIWPGLGARPDAQSSSIA